MLQRAINFATTFALLLSNLLVVKAQNKQSEKYIFAGLQGVSMAFLSWNKDKEIIDFQILSDNESEYFNTSSVTDNHADTISVAQASKETYLYTDIYDNIDLILEREHNHSGKIKVKFVLFPGANPNDITFDLKGWIQSEMMAQGTVQSESKWGWFFMNTPRAYQEYSVSGIVEVDSEFEIEDEAVGVKLGDFEKISSLTIEFDMEWIPEINNKLITAFKSEF